MKISDVTFTRFGLLSKVAGLFDKLGTAALITVKGKIKLRELCVKGLSWNDPVPAEDKTLWEQYFEEIEKLKGVEIPRCLLPEEDQTSCSWSYTPSWTPLRRPVRPRATPGLSTQMGEWWPGWSKRPPNSPL